MKKLIALALLLPCLALAQIARVDDMVIYWDAAYSDSQWAIRGTDSVFSQAFRVATDMTLLTFIQAGDTAGTPDSTKVRIYAQFGPSASGPWKYMVAGVDSLGLDSTGYDSGANMQDGSPGNAFQPIRSISITTPLEYCRLGIVGLGTNCKAASDSTKGSCHVKRYSVSQN